MKMRNILILIIILFFFAVTAAGFFSWQTAENATSTTNDRTDTGTTESQSNGNQQSQSHPSDFISASEAQSIASHYLSSNNYANYEAGTPTLKESVYYIPMVVANDYSQDAKGTVVGNIRVDARTGSMLGIQSQDLETG